MHEAFTRRDPISDYVDEKFPRSEKSLRSAIPLWHSVDHKWSIYYDAFMLNIFQYLNNPLYIEIG